MRRVAAHLQIHLDIWNGVKFKQSPGIHVVADNSSTLVSGTRFSDTLRCQYEQQLGVSWLAPG
jgi:hypothetical protein